MLALERTLRLALEQRTCGWRWSGRCGWPWSGRAVGVGAEVAVGVRAGVGTEAALGRIAQAEVVGGMTECELRARPGHDGGPLGYQCLMSAVR